MQPVPLYGTGISGVNDFPAALGKEIGGGRRTDRFMTRDVQTPRAREAAAGERPLTLRQIADLAGTSKSTVSRVLTDHPRISDATRERVLDVIRTHRYRPNAFARALAGGQTGFIGVLASHIDSLFYAEVIRGIDLVAQRESAHLVCSFAHGPEDFVALYQRMAADGQVQGLILIAPPLDLFETRPDATLPQVLCAAAPPPRKRRWRGTDFIAMDNAASMGDLLRHLLEQGLRSFLHLTGPAHNVDAAERAAAFAKIIRAHPEAGGDTLEAGLTHEDGCRALEAWLAAGRRPPDAIVSFNDSTACGALELLRERCPDRRVAITGWDDNPYSRILDITTVHIPSEQLGEQAAALLFQRCNGDLPGDRPEQHRLRLEMILRSSSTNPAAPPTAANPSPAP